MTSMTAGNFVCRFGEAEVLIDFLFEIVLPSFFDDSLIRERGTDTEYLIYEPKIIDFGTTKKPWPCIYGTFLKDSILRSDFAYAKSSKQILPRRRKIESAEFSRFLLSIPDHKIIYLPVTKQAPSLSEFGTTINYFAKESRKKFINRQKENLSNQGVNITKRELRDRVPKPKIHVLYLISQESIEEYVSQFKVLRTFQIRLLKTNAEGEYSSLLNKIRQQGKPVEPDHIDLVFSNKEGLNKEGVPEPIKSAAKGGNSLVKLDGINQNGGRLIIDNRNLRVRMPTETAEDAPDQVIANEMYEAYSDLRKSNVIGTPPKLSDQEQEKIRRLSQENK